MFIIKTEHSKWTWRKIINWAFVSAIYLWRIFSEISTLETIGDFWNMTHHAFTLIVLWLTPIIIAWCWYRHVRMSIVVPEIQAVGFVNGDGTAHIKLRVYLRGSRHIWWSTWTLNYLKLRVLLNVRGLNPWTAEMSTCPMQKTLNGDAFVDVRAPMPLSRSDLEKINAQRFPEVPVVADAELTIDTNYKSITGNELGIALRENFQE
ncbi:MAG: hypothetical protein ABSE73_19305 [Planctomycetota bacterium]